jgi:hypothetical protein
MFKKIIALYSENHTKTHKYKMKSYRLLKQVGHTVTIGLVLYTSKSRSECITPVRMFHVKKTFYYLASALEIELYRFSESRLISERIGT